MEPQTLDHKTCLARLDPDMRAQLTTLSNTRGLAHLVGHSALIGGFAALIAVRVPGWPILILPQGVLLAFLFTLQHECTHKTPFRSGILNEIAGHGAGFVIFQPFQWFRYFHLAHHRHTNDPDRDPELTEAPKPQSWSALLWHLATLPYWRDKAGVLIANARGQIVGDYVPASAKARIIVEARVMIVGYALALGATILWPVLLWVWIIPLATGFPVLRFYHLAEHGHCAFVTDMFQNSRTVLTNRIIRFVTWNMPFHAEHHALPAVPFHKLPALHDATKDHLGVLSKGYLTFARDYAKHFTP